MCGERPMPLVLTIGSQITCTHQAPVSLSSDAKLSVMGARVLVLPVVVGAQIVGCTNPDSSSSKKCLMVAAASGTATKLTVAGDTLPLHLEHHYDAVTLRSL